MSEQALLLEVEDLQQRLEEAEDTLRAIRCGEVDAVVVSAPIGDQIFVLKGAEQPYRIFLETMNEGAATLLADGTIAYGNRAFAGLLQSPLEQVIGASLESFVAPDHRARLRLLLGQALAGNAKDEIPFRSAGGTTVWAEISLSPTKLENQAGICLISTDITERRRVRELRAYLAAIVDSTEDAIIGKDLDGTILSWNRGAEKLYGYTAHEIIGQSISLLFPPEGAEEALSILDRVGRGEMIERHETERVRKDGRPIQVSVTVSSIRDLDGHIAGVATVAHDISAHKRAEEELRRAGTYNRSLIEASLDPLVVIAPDGTITDVNIATEKATGCSRTELIGTDFCNYFTDPEKARAGYQQVLQKGWTQDYELEIRRRDGTTTPVLYNASLYRDEAGETVGIFAAARDIAERKRAEAEVRELNASLERRVAERTAELVAANKELESFSYSVSHDLRAPLRAMDGFSQALMEDCADQLDEVGKSHLARVRAGCQRMDQLVDGILNLSRMSRSALRRTVVDLSGRAQTIARELQSTNPERQVEFVVAPGLVVNADPNLLGIVLHNLLENAWKFTGKHPRARIEVGAAQQAGETVFFVRDDGAGFNMAYADQLFGAFQRLHPPKEFEGTGIGLATVQRIVHRHGGRLWAEAEVEKGATFFFTMPGNGE